MTRYFYDCPLKAAWMAKYHGMRFEDAELSIIGNSSTWYHVNPANGSRYKGLYYIHPDSLHLLEPIDGDIGTIKESGDIFIYDIVWWFYERIGKMEADGDLINIIQRNGTAFHWPESEEA